MKARDSSQAIGAGLFLLGAIAWGAAILIVLLWGKGDEAQEEKEPMKPPPPPPPPPPQDEGESLWFIQAMGPNIAKHGGIGGSKLERLLTEVREIVNPSFFVMTGGLVDVARHYHFYSQIVWQSLKEETLSLYHDLPNWEDAHGFLEGSIQGPVNKRIHHSWSRRVGEDEYRFVALDTVPRTYHAGRGQFPSQQLAYLCQEEDDHPQAAGIVVFGHCSTAQVRAHHSGKEDFWESMLRASNVRAYLAGKGEFPEQSNFARQIYLDEKRSFVEMTTDPLDKTSYIGGSRAKDSYRIFVLTHGEIASTVCELGVWPQVVIFSPVDQNACGITTRYLRAPELSRQKTLPIKALVFGDEPVGKVFCKLEDYYYEMTRSATGKLCWEAFADISQCFLGASKLTVTAVLTNGATNSSSITIKVIE